MKVIPTGNANYISGNYRTGKFEAHKNSRSASRNDEAMLSEEAVSFSKIMASIRESADLRTPEEETRIATIKQQLQAGEYRVDSDALAESILVDVFG